MAAEQPPIVKLTMTKRNCECGHDFEEHDWVSDSEGEEYPGGPCLHTEPLCECSGFRERR